MLGTFARNDTPAGEVFGASVALSGASLVAGVSSSANATRVAAYVVEFALCDLGGGLFDNECWFFDADKTPFDP